MHEVCHDFFFRTSAHITMLIRPYIASKTAPSLDYDMLTADGRRGWIGSWYTHVSDDSFEVADLVREQYIDETRLFISTSYPKGITKRWTLKLRGQLKPREADCTFEFGLTVAGRGKVRFALHVLRWM